MHPTLHAGDWIITTQHRGPRIHDIVVSMLESNFFVVKRVQQIDGDSLVLAGDNPRLNSSYCDNPMPITSWMGTVLASFRYPFKFRFEFSATL